MAYYFLDFNITFQLASGIVALLVSYYAFRYNRFIENSTLKFISIGFLLLGVGLVTEGSTFFFVAFGVGRLVDARIFAIGTSISFNLLQIVAYFIFALGYIRSAFFSPKPGAESIGNGGNGNNKNNSNTSSLTFFLLAPFASLPLSISGIGRFRDMVLLSRAVFLYSELLALVFLIALVFAGILAYLEHRNRLSLLVLISFVLLLASHAVDLLSVIHLSDYLNAISSGIQFIGFLSLLTFLLWSSRIGSARKAT